jgi:hypothetical protein
MPFPKATEVHLSAQEQTARPISQWTAREIADAVMKRKIVDEVSARHTTWEGAADRVRIQTAWHFISYLQL